MDRRLLFPAVAATAWAQQSNPAAVEAEKALRDRVQEFYQLQTDKKYRQAESFVADDTKDDYYAARKPDIKGFTIDKVELLDGNTEAKVIIKAKVLVLMMGAGAQVFEMPTPTTWKLENGQWCWYISEEVKSATPFGRMRTNVAADGGTQPSQDGRAPSLSTLQNQLSLDHYSVLLSADSPIQSAVIANGLPGSIDLRIDPHAANIKGLAVSIDKTHLNSGEKATIRFELTGAEKISDNVQVVAQPLNRPFDIQVTTK